MVAVNENLLPADQRTEGWYRARSGKFTGSRFVDVLAKGTKAYDNLIDQLVVERLTGDFVDAGGDYAKPAALKWGIEVEPFARQAYQFETGELVVTSGFIQHPIMNFVGVSPDGKVAPRGGTEFKCPKNSAIHLARFRTGIEPKYIPQVQGCIWVCECDWWDWVSFDPRMPPHVRFYRQRIWRDDTFINNLEREILLAEAEVRTRLEGFTPARVAEILLERAAKPEDQEAPLF